MHRDDNYKKAKEEWVSELTGSSVLHVNLLSLVALCSIALYHALDSRSSKSISFPTAWFILVLPLLFSMTIFANSPLFLSLILLVSTALILLLRPPRHSATPLPSPNPTTRQRQQDSYFPPVSQLPPLPFITIYRAHMMLMTVLAILAVDFPVFPRSLAKCETFGVSMMDMGVGSFVFSQGLVSAIPLIKNPSYLSAPALPKIVSVTTKSLPIIFLGLVRVVLVKGTEYPEHISEYGAHWNFFITLALLPILQVILHPAIKYVPLALLGVFVASAHQLTLSLLGLQDFVLNAPRTGLISANKEGIASLAGYLAVHLLGLSAGSIVLPPFPRYLSKSLKAQNQLHPQNNTEKSISLALPRQSDSTAIELCSYAIVWWVLLGISRLIGIGGKGVSRRMVNLPYIFWVAAYNTSFILGYLLLDMWFYPSRSYHSQTSKLKIPVDGVTHTMNQQQHPHNNAPLLLEALNRNSLALFLVANVATGLINLSMQTMYTSDTWAMVVLAGYAFSTCWIAWIFRGHRLVRL